MAAASSSSSEVSLTIKCVGAECCQLRVALDLSVRDLKQAVAAQMDVPVERQRLIYGGQVLKDDLPLRHYKLEDGVVVHLVARPEGATANAANDEPPTAEPRRPRRLLWRLRRRRASGGVFAADCCPVTLAPDMRY